MYLLQVLSLVFNIKCAIVAESFDLGRNDEQALKEEISEMFTSFSKIIEEMRKHAEYLRSSEIQPINSESTTNQIRQIRWSFERNFKDFFTKSDELNEIWEPLITKLRHYQERKNKEFLEYETNLKASAKTKFKSKYKFKPLDSILYYASKPYRDIHDQIHKKKSNKKIDQAFFIFENWNNKFVNLFNERNIYDIKKWKKHFTFFDASNYLEKTIKLTNNALKTRLKQSILQKVLDKSINMNSSEIVRKTSIDVLGLSKEEIEQAKELFSRKGDITFYNELSYELHGCVRCIVSSMNYTAVIFRCFFECVANTNQVISGHQDESNKHSNE